MISVALENDIHRFDWDLMRFDESIITAEVMLTTITLNNETGRDATYPSQHG